MTDPSGGLWPGVTLTWDGHSRILDGGSLLAGGSPWRVFRVGRSVAALALRLRAAGVNGLAPADGREMAAAEALVERGLAHPRVDPEPSIGGCAVVVPAHDRASMLDRCLSSLGPGPEVVVVDDGSVDAEGVARAARAHGARLFRHRVNRGPAAARNTGLAAIREEFVAFIDSDCIAPPGWLESLLPHFKDPRVALVAPRVRPSDPGSSWPDRFDAVRSALDMGPDPALVRPGGRLGYVPSAAMVLRRSVLADLRFDPSLRVGEDVDLVWRLVARGWHVRYEPGVVVGHRPQRSMRAWLARQYEYGTSATPLDMRHPGRLAPASVSAWSLLSLLAAVRGRPMTAALAWSAGASLLGRRFAQLGLSRRSAARLMGDGAWADAVAVGHALRREWWPAGWLLALCGLRWRTAARAGALMVVPLAVEHVRSRPALDPLRYVVMRLVADAAYGSGVLAGAWRAGHLRTILPRVSAPAAIADGWRLLRARL